MIKHYLHTRLKPFSFLVLSILFSLMFNVPEDSLKVKLFKVLFLMLSFLVFRLLDDAGSVQYDRNIHSDRSYLSPSNYPTFIRFTAVSCLAYLQLGLMRRCSADPSSNDSVRVLKRFKSNPMALVRLWRTYFRSLARRLGSVRHLCSIFMMSLLQ